MANGAGIADPSIPARIEAKYLVHPRLVPEIRQFIAPYCYADPNGRGTPPEYVITTMLLDGPSLPLFTAKINDARRRFKLRVRYYGEQPKGFVFTEVKKKFDGLVIKSRAAVPLADWQEGLLESRKLTIDFRSEQEELAFLEFVRLYRLIGARPTASVRYVRESYMGTREHYARVTMDRALKCRPCRSITDLGATGRWAPNDSGLRQEKEYRHSSAILELKCQTNVPQWITDVVERFELRRVGHSKYGTAVMQGLENRSAHTGTNDVGALDSLV